MCSLASFLDKNESGVYNSVLFVLDGAPMDNGTIWRVFAQLFAAYSGSALSFADYRQLVKYFAHLIDMSSCEEEGEDYELWPEASPHLSIDEQFGHSSVTANLHYGRHDGEMGATREHMLHAFRMQSFKWHHTAVATIN